jgi:hypothetical protein
MSNLTLTCGIVVGLMVAYGVGYRNGVAYCVRAHKPLVDAARELHRMMRR